MPAATSPIDVPDRGDLHVYSPSGVVARADVLKRSVKRLGQAGYRVTVDAAALARHQRFAGDDDTRLAALHRVAAAAPHVALASRGGYGLTRLLDRIDWKLIAQAVEAGTHWVGHSDQTALQAGLLAHIGNSPGAVTWHGPLACADFGVSDADGGLDEVTPDCFHEAVSGELEAIGFRVADGHDGLAVSGRLWGGNLCVLTSLLGTPHWPRVRGGILYLEDVNEHPYRVERMLLQLHQAGVLGAQKAILLGDFSGWKKSPLDRGYNLKAMVEHLRSVCPVPVLTGLPIGHGRTKVTIPSGLKADLVVQGRDALVAWG